MATRIYCSALGRVWTSTTHTNMIRFIQARGDLNKGRGGEKKKHQLARNAFLLIPHFKKKSRSEGRHCSRFYHGNQRQGRAEVKRPLVAPDSLTRQRFAFHFGIEMRSCGRPRPLTRKKKEGVGGGFEVTVESQPSGPVFKGNGAHLRLEVSATCYWIKSSS